MKPQDNMIGNQCSYKYIVDASEKKTSLVPDGYL